MDGLTKRGSLGRLNIIAITKSSTITHMSVRKRLWMCCQLAKNNGPIKRYLAEAVNPYYYEMKGGPS